jgi:hypothetical protein
MTRRVIKSCRVQLMVHFVQHQLFFSAKAAADLRITFYQLKPSLKKYFILPKYSLKFCLAHLFELINLFAFLPFYLSTFLPFYLSTFLPFYLSTFTSFYLSIFLSLSLSFLSVYLTIRISVYVVFSITCCLL